MTTFNALYAWLGEGSCWFYDVVHANGGPSGYSVGGDGIHEAQAMLKGEWTPPHYHQGISRIERYWYEVFPSAMTMLAERIGSRSEASRPPCSKEPTVTEWRVGRSP